MILFHHPRARANLTNRGLRHCPWNVPACSWRREGGGSLALKRVKKLVHFLVDRIAKFKYLCLEQGQGFVESAESPFTKSCWVPPHGSLRSKTMGYNSRNLVNSVHTMACNFKLHTGRFHNRPFSWSQKQSRFSLASQTTSHSPKFWPRSTSALNNTDCNFRFPTPNGRNRISWKSQFLQKIRLRVSKAWNLVDRTKVRVIMGPALLLENQLLIKSKKATGPFNYWRHVRCIYLWWGRLQDKGMAGDRWTISTCAVRLHLMLRAARRLHQLKAFGSWTDVLFGLHSVPLFFLLADLWRILKAVPPAALSSSHKC